MRGSASMLLSLIALRLSSANGVKLERSDKDEKSFIRISNIKHWLSLIIKVNIEPCSGTDKLYYSCMQPSQTLVFNLGPLALKART